VTQLSLWHNLKKKGNKGKQVIDDTYTLALVKYTAGKYNEDIGKYLFNELFNHKHHDIFTASNIYNEDARETAKALRYDEVVKIVHRHYMTSDEKTTRSIIKGLSNPYLNNDFVEHITEMMAIPEVVETVDKYSKQEDIKGIIKSDRNSLSIARSLSTIANHIDNKEIMIDCARTINMYEDPIAIVVASELRHSSYNKDSNFMRFIIDIMSDDNTYNLYQKYYDKNNTMPANNIIKTIGKIGYSSKDKNVVNTFAEILKRYDDNEAKRIANGIEGLDIKRTVKTGKHEKTYHLRDTDSYHKIITNILESMSNIYEKDPTTAMIVGENATKIVSTFGERYEDILNYMEKSNERFKIHKIKSIANPYDVGEALKEIKLKTTGKRQISRLINLAAYLDANHEFGLKPDLSEDLQEAIASARDSLKKYMKKHNIEDIDKGIEFLPWIKKDEKGIMGILHKYLHIPPKDNIALKVLNGEKIEKTGISKAYPISSRTGDQIRKNIKDEIQSYVKMLNLNITVENEDIDYLKGMAKSIMLEIEKPETKKNLTDEMRGEIIPNLNRILKLREESSKNYMICFNPNDIETQMKALQDIGSCLSPDGCNFKYTEIYLENSDTFFPVIRENNETGPIVGRLTAFFGKSEETDPEGVRNILDCNDDDKVPNSISRASNIYSVVPFAEEDIDESFMKYANDSNLEFIENGVISVNNLDEIYDDRVRGSNSKVIVGTGNSINPNNIIPLQNTIPSPISSIS